MRFRHHPHLALHRRRAFRAFCRRGGWPAAFPVPFTPSTRRAGRGLAR